MPIDSHLSWAEIRNFSPGLWTIGKEIMTPNAAQQMTDCYANPGGGLRAWFKPSTITTSGLVNAAQEACAGFFSRDGIPNRAGPGVGSDFYMLTINFTTGVCRLYRMDQTNSATTWSVIKTFAAVTAPGLPHWATWAVLNLNSGAVHVLMSLFQTSTDDGVWSVNYSDGAVAKAVATPWSGPITVHQSRLIASGGGINQASLTFSDPGAETGLGTNIITTENSRNLGEIMGISSFSPGDLLVQKAGAPFFLVEGDLSNYTLRQMNDSKGTNGWNSATFGPMGVIFACTQDGVYETPEGQLIMPLSKQLAGIDINPQSIVSNVANNWASMAFAKHWLMLGNGLVYNYDTQTWFKSSFLTNANGGTVWADRFLGTFYAAGGGVNFSLYSYNLSEDAIHRCETYTWQSAPLRDPSGRQVELRSAEVYAYSTNGATSTITVTVNGVGRTIACDSSGRGAITFYFKERREELDITVLAASNATGIEAPRIETIRIGTQGGHFLTSAADAG